MTGTTEELPIVDPADPVSGGDGIDDADDVEEIIVHRKRLVTPLTWGLLFVLGLSLAFFGGVRVEKSQSSAGVASGGSGFAGAGGRGAAGAAATGARAGANPTSGAGTGGAGGAGGAAAAGGGGAATANGTGATFGQVKLVDGTNVYVQDQQGNIVKISTQPGMVVTVSKPGTVADLKPGDTVVARGQAGPDGTVAATSLATANGVGGFGGGGGGGRAARNGGQGAASATADNPTRTG